MLEITAHSRDVPVTAVAIAVFTIELALLAGGVAFRVLTFAL